MRSPSRPAPGATIQPGRAAAWDFLSILVRGTLPRHEPKAATPRDHRPTVVHWPATQISTGNVARTTAPASSSTTAQPNTSRRERRPTSFVLMPAKNSTAAKSTVVRT